MKNVLKVCKWDRCMAMILYTGGFFLGVRRHHFEYDAVVLIDLFCEGLVMEMSSLEGGSKARACG